MRVPSGCFFGGRSSSTKLSYDSRVAPPFRSRGKRRGSPPRASGAAGCVPRLASTTGPPSRLKKIPPSSAVRGGDSNRSHAVVEEIIGEVTHAGVAVSALDVLVVGAEDHARGRLAHEQAGAPLRRRGRGGGRGSAVESAGEGGGCVSRTRGGRVEWFGSVSSRAGDGVVVGWVRVMFAEAPREGWVARWTGRGTRNAPSWPPPGGRRTG